MLEDKNENKLIEEISNLAETELEKSTVKLYLVGVIESLKTEDQKIEDAAPFLRGAVLQRVTRDEGRRSQATDLTIQLLGGIGEHEASYFSDYLSALENNLQKTGRSWFRKKSELISDLTSLSRSLSSKKLEKEADYVDALVKDISGLDN